MLCKSGTYDQMRACGLATVKQQLRLKKLLSPETEVISISPIPRKSEAGKLSMPAIKSLTAEDRRLYLIK